MYMYEKTQTLQRMTFVFWQHETILFFKSENIKDSSRNIKHALHATSLCIDASSITPHTVMLRHIDKLVSHRLSQNSSNKNIFGKATPDYTIALRNSRFNQSFLSGLKRAPTGAKN